MHTTDVQYAYGTWVLKVRGAMYKTLCYDMGTTDVALDRTSVGSGEIPVAKCEMRTYGTCRFLCLQQNFGTTPKHAEPHCTAIFIMQQYRGRWGLVPHSLMGCSSACSEAVDCKRSCSTLEPIY